MKEIASAQTLVIKIGSSLLTDDRGQLNRAWLQTLLQDVAQLHAEGKSVVLVSSGSIALGYRHISRDRSRLKIEEKQAAAACGQVYLIEAYHKLLSEHGIVTAQVLLTLGDSESRRRYMNAQNTLDTLLHKRIVPVVNENDTVATAEIRYGDNDRLAARVAQMVRADMLILLSDVDGLYTANPVEDASAEHIARVEAIDDAIRNMAGDSHSAVGSGGMVTKIAAAHIAVESGCHTIIAPGKQDNPLKQLISGRKHTLFVSNQTPTSARKQWIAHHLNPNGKIVVDEGAVRALKKGNSLLPAGIVDIVGNFQRGDAVQIVDKEGAQLGKGLTAYGAEDIQKIMGHHSGEIETVLGYSGRDTVIHRNDMALLPDL